MVVRADTSALGIWVRQARADRSKGKTGLTTEERAELGRLRKEVRELRMERDIQKKLRGARRSVLLDQKLWEGVFCAATEGSGRQLFGGSTP
jgi:transposase-like protein